MAVESKLKEKSKKDSLASITNVFKGFKAEAKRITWPTKQDIQKAAKAVLILCAIYMAYVVVLDSTFKYLFNLILGIK